MKASSLRNFLLTTKCKSANIRLLIRHKQTDPLHWPPHDWGAHLRFAYSYAGLRGKYSQLLKKIDIGIFCLLFTTLRLVFWNWMKYFRSMFFKVSRYFYVESEFTVASLCSRGDSLCFRKQYHRRQDGGWMLSRPNLADAHISWAACRKRSVA